MPDSGAGIELRVEVWPRPLVSPGPVRWTFLAHNRGRDPVTLTFPSSQLGEVLLERDEIEVYRWSRDKLFATVVEDRSIDPGETWSFILDDTLEVQSGSYRLAARLSAHPDPPSFRTTIDIRRV